MLIALAMRGLKLYYHLDQTSQATTSQVLGASLRGDSCSGRQTFEANEIKGEDLFVRSEISGKNRA